MRLTDTCLIVTVILLAISILLNVYLNISLERTDKQLGQVADRDGDKQALIWELQDKVSFLEHSSSVQQQEQQAKIELLEQALSGAQRRIQELIMQPQPEQNNGN